MSLTYINEPVFFRVVSVLYASSVGRAALTECPMPFSEPRDFLERG